MPINGKQTYYEFFGLENFESDMVKIKSAYRSMALKWHPDRNEDKVTANRMIVQVNEIWEVFSKKKESYDRYLRRKIGIEDEEDNPFTTTFTNSTWTFDFERMRRQQSMMDEIIKQQFKEAQKDSFIKSLSDDEFGKVAEFVRKMRISV